MIQTVVAGTVSSSSRSIFDDVEDAKLRTVQARRVLKRRLESTSLNERSSQQFDLSSVAAQVSAEDRIKSAMRALFSAETELMEKRGIIKALLDRRASLGEEIASVKEKIESLKSKEPPIDVQRTISDMVASSSEEDDLSSVICPFELMGICTDLGCPHMHLNR